MAWEQLSINRPHLVYIILGGFTTLFMLCSSVIKERLYIGEATVATICGIIFGPHAANLIDPNTWGNPDQITLEFARIVLVVQCFAVGVELPKSYMERHWKSVFLLLVPVMTFGWLITSLFIWWMFGARLDWLDSLCVAACVTATDPVLASSVVGKGKFAKRVPKHLRDLLSAESGCNDGMAFPFIYLALYLIRYRPDAGKVSFHWFCFTILYECVFGCFYGVVIGYIARRAVRYAHERDLIDRESFLVFYFVLALFCAGSGSLLGMDDLLIGFAAGVGFSNDGWFQEKTEESHVSNVIDLLINLAFFVYFGTIIPWDQFNQAELLGITPWRLVVVGIMVVFFRRIPIMLALKTVIPDIKTWREATFAGHFGPIGVGAIFVAILARAELETEGTTPLADLPKPGFEHLNIIEMIWPITCFLVIVSIIVHGSSVAVFTLGKHINTLTLTLSYTQANEDGPSWMDRLPRIQSRSKSSMSARRPDDTESSYDVDEKMDYQDGVLPPIGIPGNFLRRQKEEDSGSRSSSIAGKRSKKKWDAGIGPGGPVSQSAIGPTRPRQSDQPTDSDTIAVQSDESPDETSSEKKRRPSEPELEFFEEGDHDVIEDEEGNVLAVRDSHGESQKERKRALEKEGMRVMKEKDVEHGVSQTEHEDDLEGGQDDAKTPEMADAVTDTMQATQPTSKWQGLSKKTIAALRKKEDSGPSKAPQKKHGPALAYQFGNTIIVEDEDGEVIKKYDIPAQAKPQRPRLQGDRKSSFVDPAWMRGGMHRMGTYIGLGHAEDSAAGPSEPRKPETPSAADDDDDKIRFVTAGGRRMSKIEFIQQIQRMDFKSRAKLIEDSNVPEPMKRELSFSTNVSSSDEPSAAIKKTTGKSGRPVGPGGLSLVDSNNEEVPFHPVSNTLANYSFNQGGRETAAQRRRRLATHEESEDDSGPRPTGRRIAPGPASGTREESHSPTALARPVTDRLQHSYLEEGETAAERRRRLAALGDGGEDSSSSEEDEAPGGQGFRDPTRRQQRQQPEETPSPSVRFAPENRPSASTATPATPTANTTPHHSRGSGLRLRWGADVGQKPGDSNTAEKKK